MQSDERLCRVWDPQKGISSIVRLADFRPCKQEQLPGIKVLLDGLSRQSKLDAQEGEDGASEEGLIQAFIASKLSPVCFAIKSFDPGVPRSFSVAVRFPKWRASIDREYWAHRKRKNWICVPRTPEMAVVPYTWVFKLKKLDAAATQFLEK